jgi:hypothetical protein
MADACGLHFGAVGGPGTEVCGGRPIDANFTLDAKAVQAEVARILDLCTIG